MRSTIDTDALVGHLLAALGVTITARHDPEGPIAGGSWTATSEGAETIAGHGCGPDRTSAVLIALMESLERTSQFGAQATPVATVDSATALGPRAVHVPDLGLYTPEQYRRWPADFAPFDDRAPVAWVRGRRLNDGSEVLVPIEAVHPHAPTPGTRVVLETSSGTAAGTDPQSALAAALCEAVERDACLRWWHTRPSTTTLDLSSSADLGLAQERLAATGFVLVARLLPSVTGLPVVMVVALRGAEAAIGAGCAPHPADAARHAMRELSARLRWVRDFPDRRALHLPLALVRGGADHVALYDRGPLHSELRRALEETATHEAVHAANAAAPGTPPDPGAAVAGVLGAGLDPVVMDLPVPGKAEHVFVRRVLTPGLVPFWVGIDHERLWSPLLGIRAPGTRIRTLLPHPFG